MRSLPLARSGESVRSPLVAAEEGKADGRKAVSWRAMLVGRAPAREEEASGEVEACERRATSEARREARGAEDEKRGRA